MVQSIRQMFLVEVLPAALPVLWSVGITMLLSSLFWLARWYWLTRWMKRLQNAIGSVLYVGFGTELFAILVAVDLSVVLGLVEIWRLGTGEFPPIYYRIVAAIMLPLTCYVGVVGLIWERQAFQAWWRNETAKAAGTPVLERRSHLIAYARWWSRATVLRWMISASHLWWIIKVPRWALFQ